MKNTERRKPPAAGKGRPKGALNKSTVSVKEALTRAFDDLGGTSALVMWGKTEPGEFYKLWAKLLPQDIKHEGVVGTLDIAKGISEQSCTAIAKEMLVEAGYEFDDESL